MTDVVVANNRVVDIAEPDSDAAFVLHGNVVDDVVVKLDAEGVEARIVALRPVKIADFDPVSGNIMEVATRDDGIADVIKRQARSAQSREDLAFDSDGIGEFEGNPGRN